MQREVEEREEGGQEKQTETDRIMWVGGKGQKGEIYRDRGNERKERMLHYGRSNSPLEAAYLFSRQEKVLLVNALHCEMESSEVSSANEPTCPESSSF